IKLARIPPVEVRPSTCAYSKYFPSGDQSVTNLSKGDCRSISSLCGLPDGCLKMSTTPFCRLEEKARSLPSGDQAGIVLPKDPKVNCDFVFCFKSKTHKSEAPGWVISTASCCPSRERRRVL